MNYKTELQRPSTPMAHKSRKTSDYIFQSTQNSIELPLGLEKYCCFARFILEGCVVPDYTLHFQRMEQSFTEVPTRRAAPYGKPPVKRSSKNDRK